MTNRSRPATQDPRSDRSARCGPGGDVGEALRDPEPQRALAPMPGATLSHLGRTSLPCALRHSAPCCYPHLPAGSPQRGSAL